MLIWARSFFTENNWKKNETTKPPSQELLRVAKSARHIISKKIRRLQEVLLQAQAKDNGREGERKMLCGTTRLYSNRMGCRNPVQWPSCFIALFSLFEFSKIRCKTPETQWQILPRWKGAQSKFKSFYCISMLLLCRAPIEVRDLQNICIAKLLLSIVSVVWACRSIPWSSRIFCRTNNIALVIFRRKRTWSFVCF